MVVLPGSLEPSLSELEGLALLHKTLPVYMTLPAGLREPLELFGMLKKQSRHCFLLESKEDKERWGRYTFLGFDPVLGFTCKDGALQIRAGATFTPASSDPKAVIRAILAEYGSLRLPGLPPFTGGLVGYLSYDYIAYEEPTLKLDALDEEGFMDIDLMLFETVIVYDRLQSLIYLITNIHCDALAENYHKAEYELCALAGLIAGGVAQAAPPLQLDGPFAPQFDEARYCQMVRQAQKRIYEGDIFQVVLSNRLKAPARGSLLDSYRILAEINPSPYLFYFASDHIELAGASPETLVKLNGRRALTFPLAGTRPRGDTPEADLELEHELLADEKELAEHNMLVDLGRNDLGKVSVLGTVKVEEYLNVQRFSHVMHLGSTVSAELREDCDALDLVAAILPAGTLSGAPKLRACEIINELEGSRRGIYGGAIGYFGFNGDMDTCIAIRLAFMKGGQVFVRSGAGIVADSVPEMEYRECLQKMQGVLDALAAAVAEGAAGAAGAGAAIAAGAAGAGQPAGAAIAAGAAGAAGAGQPNDAAAAAAAEGGAK